MVSSERKSHCTLEGVNKNDYITISDKLSSVSIHKKGATIISWRYEDRELLFVSSQAIWDGSKPIRGGIPLVFPQFGTGPLMDGQHGFARNEVWQLEKINDSTVIAKLQWNENTLSKWPHKFELTYIVSLENGNLVTELVIVNLNETASFDFTTLLHTYFSINHINNVKVFGLQGLKYVDKLQDGKTFIEEHPFAQIDGEVDRNYLNTPDELKIKWSEGVICLKKENLPDAVLWNPWIAKSKSMADFEDEEYLRMVCLEAGHVGDYVRLKAGSQWKGKQTLEFSLGQLNV